ncbi:unnamed protein product [Ambrosiozyma monospora]|uniref:Unnamed protein product n=1 Tax=Ambrosiozyma monospora TaxID=43982 RepID=A0ACB5U4Z8_AMBMO|nr:unnamed protein product [Ambrosiozyma monospora]
MVYQLIKTHNVESGDNVSPVLYGLETTLGELINTDDTTDDSDDSCLNCSILDSLKQPIMGTTKLKDFFHCRNTLCLELGLVYCHDSGSVDCSELQNGCVELELQVFKFEVGTTLMCYFTDSSLGNGKDCHGSVSSSLRSSEDTLVGSI